MKNFNKFITLVVILGLVLLSFNRCNSLLSQPKNIKYKVIVPHLDTIIHTNNVNMIHNKPLLIITTKHGTKIMTSNFTLIGEN